MLVVLIALLALGEQGGVEGARRVDARERLRTSLQQLESGRARRSADSSSRETRDLMGLTKGISLEVVDETQTVQGTRLAKLTESFEGEPIFNEFVTLETDLDGEETLDASGTFLEAVDADLGENFVLLTPDDALRLALWKSRTPRSRAEDVIVRRELFTDEDDKVYRGYLVQFVVTQGDGVPSRPSFHIDASSGEIKRQWDALDTCYPKGYKLYGGNEKVGRFEYGKFPYVLDLREEGDTCYLENEYARVVDCNHTSNRKLNETASFPCSQGYNDSIHGGYSPAVDALFFGTVTARMFELWYGLLPHLQKVNLRVHFGTNAYTAFWDGQAATFGDGNGRTLHPVVVLDVVAHEVTHGLTERFANLLYVNMSGAISEAFADMAAVTVEEFFSEPDWSTGEDMTMRTSGLRHMDNPTRDGFSIGKVTDYQWYFDPHFAAGPFNNVFYQLAHNYSQGIRETFGVFLHACRFYWHSMLTFESAACDVMKAAYDKGKPLDIYGKAFKSIGIEPCNIADHMVTMKANKTYDGVLVSRTTRPLFRFSAPKWSESIVVEATSEDSEVHIQIMLSHCDDTSSPDNILAEGISYAAYDLPGPYRTNVFVRLWSHSKEVHNASVTAYHPCNMTYLSYPVPNLNYENFEYFYQCQPWVDLPF